MAPITTKRPSTTRKPSSTPSSSFSTQRKKDGLFTTTKKDKRIIKHSALISRIEKSKAPSKKRRRPSKKLVTTLESLADALPDTTDNASGATAIGDMKIRHKSLKSRPGAMKKKEALIHREKERFNKNMAQMAALPAAADAMANDDGAVKSGSASGNRWAVLRDFIEQNTERKTET